MIIPVLGLTLTLDMDLFLVGVSVSKSVDLGGFRKKWQTS